MGVRGLLAAQGPETSGSPFATVSLAER
jgi:hypothetical protein